MEKIICYCKNVTESEIKNAISQGAKTLKDIQFATSASTGNSCSELNPKGVCCSEEVNNILKAENKPTGGCSCCCS